MAVPLIMAVQGRCIACIAVIRDQERAALAS
jgi:hypothetical protein